MGRGHPARLESFARYRWHEIEAGKKHPDLTDPVESFFPLRISQAALSLYFHALRSGVE